MTMKRLALLIPGFEYSSDRPLLRSAGAVFRSRGWTTRAYQWSSAPPPRDGQDFPVWFAQLRQFVRAEPIREQNAAALVGKSLGAFAASLGADLPGIWLTPPLRDSTLAADLRAATRPYLLIGSRADPSWQRVPAPNVLELGDADHNLEIPGDPVRSAEVLRDVTAAMDEFVRRLE